MPPIGYSAYESLSHWLSEANYPHPAGSKMDWPSVHPEHRQRITKLVMRRVQT